LVVVALTVRTTFVPTILWVIALLNVGTAAAAEQWTDVFVDQEDGAFDASEWLLDKKGFLPVPFVITEPAVGYGGGLGLVFFRESIREKAEAGKKGGYVTPPDIFGGAIAATENGTRAGAVGGLFTFQEDRWRYRGGVGSAHVNLDFYGIGGSLDTGDPRIGYTLDGAVSSQQVLRRLGDSNHFLALRWIYLDLDSTFDPEQERPLLSDREVARRSSGLGLSWEYDGRDNFFTPSRGAFAAVDAVLYGPTIGSDNTFQIYRAYVYSYVPLGASFVFGGRFDARAARGDVPFYQLPYIDLRGIPAVRYQDENVDVIEAELRWNVTSRWALVGFGGVGRAWGRSTNFNDAPDEASKGVGFRYQIARRLGLYVGADVAWGPEEMAWYIQAGSAWR
jgi:hypothetical protein